MSQNVPYPPPGAWDICTQGPCPKECTQGVSCPEALERACPEAVEGTYPELVEGASQHLAKAARNKSATVPRSIVI